MFPVNIAPVAATDQTKTFNVTVLTAEAAFDKAYQNLTHGVIANYRVGFWLNRAKDLVPHGEFFPILEGFAKKWHVSVETLRRRMGFYRSVREGLAQLPYGVEMPFDEVDAVVIDEQASEAAIEQVQNLIEAADILKKHEQAPKNLAANLRLEGVDEGQHKALTDIIKDLKRVVGPMAFTDRVAKFLADWYGELTPDQLMKRTKRAKKKKGSATAPVVLTDADLQSTPDSATARKSPIFADDSEVL